MSKHNYPEGVTRDKPSAIDAIRAYYQTKDDRHPVELTDTQEEIRQRLLTAHSLVLQKGSQEAAVKMLVKRFNISDRQARRDMVEAINLFGNVMKSEKEGMRYLLYEKAQKTFQMALRKGDLKAMNNALKTAVSIMGLDREDPDIPDFSKIEPSVNLMVLPEEIQQIVQNLLQLGSINLNNAPAPVTIDIPHEEV